MDDIVRGINTEIANREDRPVVDLLDRRAQGERFTEDLLNRGADGRGNR